MSQSKGATDNPPKKVKARTSAMKSFCSIQNRMNLENKLSLLTGSPSCFDVNESIFHRQLCQGLSGVIFSTISAHSSGS